MEQDLVSYLVSFCWYPFGLILDGVMVVSLQVLPCGHFLCQM